jgi:hypothetical protein
MVPAHIATTLPAGNTPDDAALTIDPQRRSARALAATQA